MGTSTGVAPATGRRIVVGVDGSTPSRAALRWALRQAALTGASVEAVAAWGFPLYVGDADFWPANVDLEAIVAHQLKRVLDEVVRPDCSVLLHALVVPGPPATALLERAEGADLLVIGSRGHSELAEMLIGSVSLHCVARAPCPVLVVHAEVA